MKPVDYYVFTLFVFILLCALLYIYKRFIAQPRGKQATGAGSEDGKDKEERLFKLYQNMEEMMDNFEAYMEDTREQVESVKRQLLEQAEGINGMLKRVEAAEAGARAAMASMRAADKPEPRGEPAPARSAERAAPAGSPRRGGKQEAVQDLLGKGMTVEQIAQKLELSINEVRLIVYGLMTRNAEQK
jgi:predicted transposase YdaD